MGRPLRPASPGLGRPGGRSLRSTGPPVHLPDPAFPSACGVPVCVGGRPGWGERDGVKSRACTQRSRLHPRRDPHRPLRQLQLSAADLRDPGLVPGGGGHGGDVSARERAAPLGAWVPSTPGGGGGQGRGPRSVSPRPPDAPPRPSGGAPRKVGGPSSWFRLLPPKLRPPALAHRPVMMEAENFTIFIKNSIRFPLFNFEK